MRRSHASEATARQADRGDARLHDRGGSAPGDRGAAGRREARAISLVYQYPTERCRDGAVNLIHSGLAVPIRRERTIGFIAVFSVALATWNEDEVRELEELALARRARDRECESLPRGAAAGRPRRADRPAQPALLPRDARPRGRPRPPLRPAAGVDRLRPRRLQGDQRPDRAPRRRRRDRRVGRARPRRRALRRHRLPRRRRRVRCDPAGVDACRRRPAVSRLQARALRAADRSGRTARPLGRCRRAQAGGRPDCVLRAGRRGALPRQGARQGAASSPSAPATSAAPRARSESSARNGR